MGMNYYFERVDLKKKWHIGKSSYGWEFHFEAHPELDVYSSEQWLNYIAEGLSKTFWKTYAPHSEFKSRLIDEEGKDIAFEEFLNVVSTEKRKESYKGEIKSYYRYLQEEEYNRMVELRKERGILLDIQLEDIHPSNCWLDDSGYSVSIGEFS